MTIAEIAQIDALAFSSLAECIAVIHFYLECVEIGCVDLSVAHGRGNAVGALMNGRSNFLETIRTVIYAVG